VVKARVQVEVLRVKAVEVQGQKVAIQDVEAVQVLEAPAAAKVIQAALVVVKVECNPQQ
jgi:hypothetical protein